MTREEALEFFGNVDTTNREAIEKRYKELIQENDQWINKYAQDDNQRAIYRARRKSITDAYNLLSNKYTTMVADSKVENPDSTAGKLPEVKKEPPPKPQPPAANMLKKPVSWLIIIAVLAIVAYMFFLIGENKQLNKFIELQQKVEQPNIKTDDSKPKATEQPQRLATFANYTETAAGLNLEMVAVEGGTFAMGCTSEQGSNCEDDEMPTHWVMVSDFYIGKFEVTQKQWRAVMGSDPLELLFKGCDDCPVENVSWNDIQEFIKKLNQKTRKKYRLPTEAEWEFAARGGTQSKGFKYAGSNNIGEVAWYDKNSGSKTNPVGRKKANELGICDMSGNVWEWCSDWHGSDYYKSSPQNNPQGTSSGTLRVMRGGSWFNSTPECRAAYRGGGTPDDRYDGDGFRLVYSIEK
ncbi:MAG TPA: formylglycine-generating enzyme family protein [Bacteroidales bacterium]|nr:formylglycine-generating enzyme family protein [Bacteroidales bacterium]